jgi:group I intron endonuclease
MQKFKGTIYQAINIQNGKSYIGKTTQNFEEYKQWHIENAFDKKIKKRFYDSLRKYGSNNFKWLILGEIESYNLEELTQQLNEAEKESIWIFRTFGADGITFDNIYGYNMTIGGEGGNTIKGLSREDREKRNKKIGSSSKGRIKTLETRQKLSVSHKGKKLSIEKRKEKSKRQKKVMENLELRKKISTTLSQTLSNPEVKKRMSNCTKELHKNPEYRKNYMNGRPRGEKHHRYKKYGKNNILSKPVLMFTKDGNFFIKEYDSANDAAKDTNIHQGNISSCARGVVKSAGGYFWKYK